MKKALLAGMLMLSGSGLCFTQSNIHRCEASVTDFNIDDKINLGGFTANVDPEKLSIKAFRFPGTKLFVTASVLYVQASPYAKGSPPVEMILTLVLSRRPYSGAEYDMKNKGVITNARVSVPLRSFEGAEIETIYLGRPEPMIIKAECNK
jgi:hypothetical protein